MRNEIFLSRRYLEANRQKKKRPLTSWPNTRTRGRLFPRDVKECLLRTARKGEKNKEARGVGLSRWKNRVVVLSNFIPSKHPVRSLSRSVGLLYTRSNQSGRGTHCIVPLLKLERTRAVSVTEENMEAQGRSPLCYRANRFGFRRMNPPKGPMKRGEANEC